jgi:alpha-1,3-rhamnosyl/mannosyltransferase
VLIDARLRTPATTGAGRVLEGLLPALARLESGIDYRVLTSAPQLWSDLPACMRLVETDVPVASLSQHWRLRRVVRDLAPDVFHYQMFDLPLGVGTPSIIVLHDLNAVLFPHYFTRRRLLARTAARVLHAISVKRCALVMTPTEAIRREVRERYRLPDSKVVAGPWGYDRASGPVSGEGEMRARLGIEGPYLLHVGVHRPHKNLERLIEAFAKLPPACASRRLVLAGPRDERFPGPAALVRSLGLQERVRFTGYVDTADRNALYRHAELFVFPSIAEGFGFPLLEAFDLGAPVACSDIAVHREVAGEAAHYFDPLDASSMARSLEAALGDPARARELRELGRERLEAFSWDRTAATTLAAYRRLAGGAS